MSDRTYTQSEAEGVGLNLAFRLLKEREAGLPRFGWPDDVAAIRVSEAGVCAHVILEAINERGGRAPSSPSVAKLHEEMRGAPPDSREPAAHPGHLQGEAPASPWCDCPTTIIEPTPGPSHRPGGPPSPPPEPASACKTCNDTGSWLVRWDDGSPRYYEPCPDCPKGKFRGSGTGRPASPGGAAP